MASGASRPLGREPPEAKAGAESIGSRTPNAVLIWGFGRHGGGLAAARFCAAQGARVAVLERKRAEELGADGRAALDAGWPWHVGDAAHPAFAEADLIVASPAIPPRVWPERHPPVVSPEGLFFSAHRGPRLAVTGTKGKSTTAAIAGALLGWPVGGNSYEPLLDLLARLGPDTPLVCELSSFQLHYLAHSAGGRIADLPVFPPAPSAFQAAIVTSLATDHLDWHPDLEHYHRAKLGVLGLTTACVLAPEAAARARELAIPMPSSPPAVRFESESFIATDGRVLAARGDLAVLGEHNARNAALAMTAALHLGVPAGAIAERLRTVRPLPHRLQTVHEAGGVRFIDDSIATTPEAAMAGIAACAGPLAVILGGSEKGAIWDVLAENIARRRAAGPVTPVVIGQTGPAIAAALARAGVSAQPAGDLDDAIRRCCAALPAGGTVLLSPACASFDMFLNFEDRGARFAEGAKRLCPVK